MHKRFNFNTFFFENSKSPQKKKKMIGILDYIWLQMREEKRREMSKRKADESEEKRKPFSHIFLEIEKRKECTSLSSVWFAKRKETKRKICHFTYMPA